MIRTILNTGKLRWEAVNEPMNHGELEKEVGKWDGKVIIKSRELDTRTRNRYVSRGLGHRGIIDYVNERSGSDQTHYFHARHQVFSNGSTNVHYIDMIIGETRSQLVSNGGRTPTVQDVLVHTKISLVYKGK